MTEVKLPKLTSFTDQRGTIQQIVDDLSFSSVLKITCAEGAVRANHFHREDYHACILTKGRMLYYERPVGSGRVPDCYLIESGDVFFTAPMLEHAMKFLEESEFWCFSKLSRKQDAYEKDTVRLEVDLTKIEV